MRFAYEKCDAKQRQKTPTLNDERPGYEVDDVFSDLGEMNIS